MVPCPRCGTIAAPGAQYCDACGTPLTVSRPPPSPRGVPAFAAPGYATAGGAPPLVAAPGQRETRSTASLVCAGFLAAVGVLFLVGAITPFARYGFTGGFAESFRLADGSGAFLLVVVVASLICIAACVGELVGLREALLAGAGVSASVGLYAAVLIVSVAFAGDGAAPWIGSFAWMLVALASIVTTTMLAVDVLKRSDRTPSPMVFAGCSLGGGITMSVGLLLPTESVGFGVQLSFDNPAVAVFTIFYAVLPALAGSAAMAMRHRAIHIVTFGVVAWYTLEWAQQGLLTRDAFMGAGLDGRFFLVALGLLVFGISAIGGGFVRWRGTSATFRSARDYALPISTVSVFVLVVLAGLVA